MSAAQAVIEEVQKSVRDLREEFERKTGRDHDKVVRISDFLDSAEEKVFQPLTAAQEQLKSDEAEIKELKKKLEAEEKNAGEVRTKVEALELELARRGAERKGDKAWKDTPEYKSLNEFCKDGVVDAERKQLLRTDSAVAGGILVPMELDTEIMKKITEIDMIRSIARVRTTSGKTMELPIRNTIPVATYEGETEQGDDSTSTYESETVTPFRQTFTTPITQDMLMDAAFDMEAEIASDAAEGFAFGEGQGFVVGTGFKQPQGFMTNADLIAAARDTGVSGELTPDSLILLTGDLKVGYDPVYVMNRRTLALIRTFRADAVTAGDASGGFLWAPGLSGAVAPTINGFPYILANSMPDVAADAYPVAFGDFRRGYTIVDRMGMSVIRDELTLKKKAIVEFTMNRWNTGQVTLLEPIKLLHVDA